jgi:hypothetical protein
MTKIIVKGFEIDLFVFSVCFYFLFFAILFLINDFI